MIGFPIFNVWTVRSTSSWSTPSSVKFLFSLIVLKLKLRHENDLSKQCKGISLCFQVGVARQKTDLSKQYWGTLCDATKRLCNLPCRLSITPSLPCVCIHLWPRNNLIEISEAPIVFSIKIMMAIINCPITIEWLALNIFFKLLTYCYLYDRRSNDWRWVPIELLKRA